MINSDFHNQYSSGNKRINILLENFHFYHQESSENEIDPKYISRKNPEHQLRNWLENEEAQHGVYLVTGYRGMGKSSLVGKVLHDLKSQGIYHVLKVNLGQENINEKEILRIITKMLFDICTKIPSKYKIFNQFLKWTNRIFSFSITIEIMLYLFGNDFLINIWDNMGFIDLSQHLETITQIKLVGSENIPVMVILVISWLITYFLKKKTDKKEIPAILNQLSTLCKRLNASVSYEKKFEWSHILGITHKQNQNYETATVQEIEYELIQTFAKLKHQKKYKFVIVLDELDKAEPSNEEDNKNDIPDYSKVSSKSDRYVTSRARREEVLRIISNMKFFLTTAQAYFIFIAGRELYEAFQADMSDRDFSISSIFTNILNIDSFLTSTRNTNNTSLMTEQFICKQILPDTIENIINKSENKSYYDKNNIYSLKNYYNYQMQKKANKNVWRDVLFLYHFTNYLAYISNGSPKKMSIFFEKNVRTYQYLKENNKIEDHVQTPKTINEYFLSFGYYTQQKINFIHYLTYPIMQTIINMSNIYGDKLLVSASFLISHIYKFHNNGFSWRNIEQTPELQEINKTPEIREFISSIIDYLNHTHLTIIPCGLYQYKFPMQITEEISYFSKISNEVSSLFNFSLDQLKRTKEHYINLLAYYKSQENNENIYNLESIHHALGDIYLLEEDYSKAIWEYEICVNLVLSESEKHNNNQSLNNLLFMTRTMLKLGLAHEKRRTDNSAFVVYESLINYLKQNKKEAKFHLLFENYRIIHLAILAQLYVLEKLDTDGIQYRHIQNAIDNFHYLINTKDNSFNPFKLLDHEDNTCIIVKADFYRKLGDILYYKNIVLGKQHACISFNKYPIYSAYNAYSKSLKSLDPKLYSEDKKQQALFSFYQSFKYNINNDAPNSKRDNYIYSIALACEDLGHVCFMKKDKEIKKYTYQESFFEKLNEYLINNDRKNSDITITNNIEQCILYYLSASRFYNLSGQRSLSSQCYKEITLVLSTYLHILKNKTKTDKDKLPGKHFIMFLDHIVHLLLISKYNQYEHIHLSEINTLKWIKGQELYEYIELCDLSIMPDIEEIVYAYYTIKLDLFILYDKNDKIPNTDKEMNSLIKFYKSRLMTGQISSSTLTASILNFRFKARFNEFLLSRLLQCQEQDLNKIELNKLITFQERKDIFIDKWINKLFNTGEIKTQFDRNFDILEFLISDSHFCLSRILEKIIPLRNTTLFNNSFKGDIYYQLLQFTHLYKQLYSYYCYGHDSDKQERLDLYLSNSKIDGTENPKGQAVLNIEKGNKEKIISYSISHPSNIYQRRFNFLKRMTYASKRTNPSKTIKVYLAENAIYYYTQACQIHNQGKSYQILIRNLCFLDDDLNNNTCQFYMAMERSMLEDRIDRINELKQMYKNSYYYDIISYL